MFNTYQEIKLMFTQIKAYAICALILCVPSLLFAAAEDTSQGMPPAMVVVAPVTSGMVAPENEFIGTVYYQEVSDVASEESGKVERVNIEEGRPVKKGDVLVELSSDLLEKSLQAMEASYEQVLSDLRKARKDFERAKNLFNQELISEQTYDDRLFDVDGLEKKAASLKAEVERLEAALQKKSIKSPFDGVVIKKHADRGEWISPGSVVATIAMDSSVDIIAEVSETITRYVRQGMDVKVTVGGEIITGNVRAIIPRGDIATRTFPVKIRARNTLSLKEGMEARVTLPAGKKEKTLIVPRDAVITASGKTVVYAVNDTNASMIEVAIIGYDGMTVGIRAEGLSEGMNVVVKGNERLRPGQPVMIQDR